jgi:hypothetical protein
LEAAAAEAAIIADQRGDISTRSVLRTEDGRQDILTIDELWEDERFDFEELFV